MNPQTTNANFLNLGCGPTFVSDRHWINLDYEPTSPHVFQADLLRPLPIRSHSMDVVYISHFIEHIPKDLTEDFLAECFRVLKPGGVLRVVVPDLEEMCRSYLRYREQQDHQKADFLVIEMIDQAVRRYPGGELAKLFRSNASQPEMVDFIHYRTGETLGHRQKNSIKNLQEKTSPINQRIRNGPLERFKEYLKAKRFQAGIWLLPRSFIRQNVSFAQTGELHHWLWDYHQLSSTLRNAGFTNPRKESHNTSQITGFPFFPLDVDQNGSPRKGAESMYVEATSPLR